MATIVLQAAGGALGGLVGGPFGALAGRALGGLAGAAIDQRLFARRRSVEGARLRGSRMLDADEGAGIARLYGTARIAGQVIWTTRFEETRTSERQGGKGGGGGGAEIVSYSYFGNVAIGLCEGPIACVRRIWADGEEMDLSGVEFRVHRGDEAQMPDPLIEAKQGAGNAPAYRGLAYVVFERLPLERWGNRIPQISCEVVRPIGAMEEKLRAVTIIPGASEHGLDPASVRERLVEGEDRLANRNLRHAGNDFSASLDELAALCPKLRRAALVVSWFADDLRAGSASVRPKVEVTRRDETEAWRVAGLSRGQARLVSRESGGPAYGGTPSDAGIVRAIRAMNARGLKVTHYPFVLMDIPAANALPDPYGGARQAAHPWRGRMTLDIAEGRAGSADGTAGARAAIERFVGAARPQHYATAGGRVHYAGPGEWSYRRMILHQAALARLAGGVDAFVIGSEMRGLTRLRDEAGRFPFVEALIAIARDVKAMLPGAKITYAADWSEYFGYQPADGSGDVFFNLDPLWADDAIDMIGIDSYLPLTDWRAEDWSGEGPDGLRSPYEPGGLRSAIAGGEYFDWYYASEADRRARRRTPITDGAAGKAWTFRAKDLRGWWENLHFERRGGAELAVPSAWVPRSKPIWLTELGCAAIDKGANQPNVFLDPKSSESHAPHFSTGARDDHQQRRFIEAHLDHWADPESNPASPIYGGRMVEAGAIHLWTWDARPFPAFPERRDVWSDGANWETGHWLTGRLGKAPLDRLIAAILTDHGIKDADVSAVDGEVGGFVLSGPGSARGEIEELMRLAGLWVRSREERLVFGSERAAGDAPALTILAEEGDGPPVERRRGEAGEVAQEAVLIFADPGRAYQSASISAASGEIGRNARQTRLDLPVTLADAEAQRFAAGLLARVVGGRETIRFALAPHDVAVEVGDVVRVADVPGRWRITRIEDGAARRVEAALVPAFAPETPPVPTSEPPSATGPVFASRPLAHFLDLPLGGGGSGGASLAVHARPWMPYALTMAGEGDSAARLLVTRPARIGRLVRALAPGPLGRLDRGNEIVVELRSGAPSSVTYAALLSGRNAAAVRAANGVWEVLQFADAEEVAPARFALRRLLRAQGGTDDAMAAGAPERAPFVLLDEAVAAVPLLDGERGLELAWRLSPASRPLDDAAAVTLPATLGLREMLPLSPVHLRARFEADGTTTLSWIRRSRVDADRWESLDVPLGEEEERYRVSIEVPGAPAFVSETTTPRLVLTAARQAELFGALPPSVAVTVAQVSPVAGPGVEARAMISRG
ncbi:baseplate multidomain protein megatron [Aureimonas mangrovi]|uniref:baseplate multidomain protein megatron n=1 Tax=Aureimonas mangrovi TaxID=2758041 RepID=UPI00163DA8A1|nr:glycoside hydrolase/phage tail family protein [Aureimonas mangrovi]